MLDQEPDSNENLPSEKNRFSGWIRSRVLGSGHDRTDTYSRTQEEQGEHLAVIGGESGTVPFNSTAELCQMELAV